MARYKLRQCRMNNLTSSNSFSGTFFTKKQSLHLSQKIHPSQENWQNIKMCTIFNVTADPEGRTGGPYTPPPLLQNLKNLGFLSNTGPDPLKKSKSYQAKLGHHRHASETPFHFADGPMMARLQWYLDSPSPHQLKKQNVVKVGPPAGPAHALSQI